MIIKTTNVLPTSQMPMALRLTKRDGCDECDEFESECDKRDDFESECDKCDDFESDSVSDFESEAESNVHWEMSVLWLQCKVPVCTPKLVLSHTGPVARRLLMC